jgi:membrane-bound lytic murein transglycosylase B
MRAVADNGTMISRRPLLAAIPALGLAGLAVVPAEAAADSFPSFLAELQAEARRKGISATTVQSAFLGVSLDDTILQKLHHPPEKTLTWAQYRALLLTPKRIAEGRAAYKAHASVLRQVSARYGVAPGIIIGIWGLESSYGATTGDYRVVEALANCAYGSTRRTFFSAELMAALEIIEQGNVAPGNMTGSYAGAMGQPQFMPTSYLRYAVDFTGTGRRNIWTSVPDVLASIANYLARNGWQAGESWGMQVSVPPGLRSFGRDDRQSLSEWARQGVRRVDGRALQGSEKAGLIQPDGAGGEAFLVYPNFNAIRRYNPSDFYALLTGLLGDHVLA